MSSNMAIALVALATSTACALAGVFLVLRRMAMMADAISHAVLPGLVGGYVLARGPNLLLGFAGAVAAGLVTVALVETITRSRRVREDAAIGIVFPFMFALGVFIITRFFANVHIDTDAVLYGEIALAPFDTLRLGGRDLGPQALWICGGLTLINACFLALLYKELKLTTFDPELGASLGFRPGLVQYVLMGLVALTTVGAFAAVGAILAVALIVTPVAVALMLFQRLPVVIGASLLIGAAAGLAGFWSAQQLDVSISGMIAVVLGLAFVAALVFSPRAGWLASALRRSEQRRRFAVDMLLVHLATHEGTAQEREESRFLHLESELGWEPGRAERIVDRAKALGLVTSRESVLHLTASGRAAAEVIARRTNGG